MEIEIEKTYLAKFLPQDLMNCQSKEIMDLYLPAPAKIRIRKSGDSYTITKKSLVREEDASEQIEQNIKITEEEFKSFSRIVTNSVHKIRYLYSHQGQTAEIDVFLDRFEGLVLIDFEFRSKEELDKFQMPEFCLADVTQEDCIAGGALSDSDFSSIKEFLEKYKYRKIFLN